MSSVLKIVQVIMLDVAVGLFFGLMVFEKTNRWPILLIVFPVLLFINVKHLDSVSANSRRTPLTMAIVYGIGLAWGLLWTAVSFEWWKLAILPMPLFFMVYFLQRARNAKQRSVAVQ
jgi:hypothetical protein